ncbi:unnamed protein product [Prunus armeniaca]
MDGAKAVSTPLSTTDSLMLYDGSSLTYATPYHCFVNGLQYLSLTCPDISFTVKKLSQFMHSPFETHWQALKRFLRYLKGTISFGLHLCRRPSHRLYAFSDADWAGDRDDRKAPVLLPPLLNSHGFSPYCVNLAFLSPQHRLSPAIVLILSYIPFVRDHVTRDLLQVSHVSTIDQLADSLTKPLLHSRFQLLRSKIGVSDGATVLQGRIRESPTSKEITSSKTQSAPSTIQSTPPYESQL